jgi:hypothetical protein
LSHGQSKITRDHLRRIGHGAGVQSWANGKARGASA